MRDVRNGSPSQDGQRRQKPECGSEKPEAGFEPYITKAVVAELIGVEIRTVNRFIKRGILRHYKVGSQIVRFKWSEVEIDMRQYFGVGFRKEAKA